jgi:hypothetical protein
LPAPDFSGAFFASFFLRACPNDPVLTLRIGIVGLDLWSAPLDAYESRAGTRQRSGPAQGDLAVEKISSEPARDRVV